MSKVRTFCLDFITGPDTFSSFEFFDLDELPCPCCQDINLFDYILRPDCDCEDDDD
jgi:hypothetical protein